MQITIIQSEIETAIRAHILSQININEGMRIDIDLMATRGAEGFKAVIDIVPEAQAPTQKVEKAEAETDVATLPNAASTVPSPAPRTTSDKPLNIVATATRGRGRPRKVVPEIETPATEQVEAESIENEVGAAEAQVAADEEEAAQAATDTSTVAATVAYAPVEEVAEAESEAEPEVASAAPARSLFANLGKPVNQ